MEPCLLVYPPIFTKNEGHLVTTHYEITSRGSSVAPMVGLVKRDVVIATTALKPSLTLKATTSRDCQRWIQWSGRYVNKVDSSTFCAIPRFLPTSFGSNLGVRQKIVSTDERGSSFCQKVYRWAGDWQETRISDRIAEHSMLFSYFAWLKYC